jgi:hypothetical protein
MLGTCRRNGSAFVCTLTLLAVLAAPALAQEEPEPSGASLVPVSRRMFVLNFPDLFKVDGEVSVKGTIRQSSLVTFRDVTVPPVSLKDTTRLVYAGTLVADGFTGVVVTLAGQLKGEGARAGSVGALLLPDEEVITRALEEQGQILLAIESKAPTGSGTPGYFASDQQRRPVAFPRYRVLLYNTTDKAATVTVFAYLVD